MKREEALAKFREEEQNYIDGIKAGFLVKIQENANDIADCLQKVFSDIRSAVEERGKKDIMFIHFSILRIDFLNHIYRFLAQVMDARWYMDTDPVEVTFFLGDCFSAFTEARQKLELDSKKYMGKVNRYDIDNLLMEAGMECNIMLANLLRFVFRDIEKNQDFESLPKLPTWGIRWGEYRDASDMIACADREKKEQKDWNRALRETKGDEGRLVSSFWYEAELQDSDCSGKALCFLQFENCSLQNMNFGKADLIGARFRKCKLTSCDFRGAILRQTIFEECKWDQCDFQGADLTECIFFEDDIPFLHLDADQLQVILIDRRA